MSAKPLPVPASGKVLVLRTCALDGTAHGGFPWPKSGPVECADWDPTPACGNGLHGLLWGDGDWSLLNDDGNRLWLVVEVPRADIVTLGDKVKFPRGEVIFCGDAAGAITRVLAGRERFDLLAVEAAEGEKVAEISSGYYSRAASSGDYSSAASSGYSSSAASSGDYSRAASLGYYSRAASSGGYSSAASSGYSSSAVSLGDYSRAASSGDYSRAASSGDYSSAASSGYSSSAASSGDYSRAASSGYYSSAASSGYYTVAMVAGLSGRAKAGANGAFALAWKDGLRPRITVGHVGEGGVKSDTWYRVNAKGALVELDDKLNDVGEVKQATVAKPKRKPTKKRGRK